ncbi:hypothetical protein yc1106_08102 [Curvularia clavata]|uniref:Heterokaryon incompatibility domain-containing protein n=1 Tax=Curvularia clavata TaxID=95742 RepID=A0A9Q9DUC0_CURCL|nr:hypothetical protein yc1106_08102 [Curvularia clavata]
MTQLPLIPSITCRHHASTPFPPPPERFREPTTAEQEQYFRDIALWLLQHDERVRDPMEELQNPNYSKLLDAIRDKHYIYSRILRFNGDDLQHGVSTGCSFCQTIIEGFHKLYGDRQFWTEYFVSFDFGDGIACLEMFKLSDKYFNDSDDIDDSDDSDDSTLWIEMLEFPLLSKREFSVSSSLEAVLNMTRAWLHTCAKEHINCAQSTSSFIPTRVLEIRSNETAKKVRLIEPRDPLSSYAALSYCWGVAEQPGWLTNAVLQQYKQGIDVFSLPQTIQDAIIVAEGLEIPHLWIDALCIIQDNSADKNHEIDQMGRIFENATITIEASRASVVMKDF